MTFFTCLVHIKAKFMKKPTMKMIEFKGTFSFVGR